MTRYPFLGRAGMLAAALALGFSVAVLPVPASAEKPKKASAVKKQGSTKFLPGSQETRKERSERLKRECKGKVDAGACAGYTQ
jgi:hypothetical protein